MSVSEEVVRNRQSVLDVGQRNQLEATQAEVRRNNEQLTTLRRENKELRSVLQQTLRGQRNVSVEDHYAKEEELLHNKMCVLKRSLNAVKAKNAELGREIGKATEENTFTQQEGSGALEEDSDVAYKIRALENRLDKCLVKHNEVNTIRRTYETLLERLQLEQAGFNTQVSSTEQALQCADKELGELVSVWKSAAKARDVAKTEVGNLKTQLASERQKQRKDLDERRTFIESKRQQLEKKHEAMLQKLTQQEERHARTLMSAASTTSSRRRGGGTRSGASSAAALRPEEVERLQEQKAAYLRLRDVTMALNVSDVLAKLRDRTAQQEQLQATSQTLEADMQALTETHRRLQTEWESVNHRAGHALVSARVMRAARDACGGHGNGSTDTSNIGAVGFGGAANEDTAASPQSAGAAAGSEEEESAAKKGGSGVAGAGAGARSSPGGAHADYGLRADRSRDRRLVLEEFHQHLHRRQDELEEAQEKHDALAQLLREVDTGVQYLAEKLSISNAAGNVTAPVVVPAAALTGGSSGTVAATTTASVTHTSLCIDLLRSCGAKLQLMLEELAPEELDAVVRSMAAAKFIIPGTNVRVLEVLEAQQQQRQQPGSVISHAGGAGRASASPSQMAGVPAGSVASSNTGGSATAVTATAGRDGEKHSADAAPASGDGYPENEIHDRQELKMMAMAAVEREQQKARKRQQQQRRNKEEVA